MLNDLKKDFFLQYRHIVSTGYCSFTNICGINICVYSENHNLRVCEHLWPIILSMCLKTTACTLINIYFHSTTKFKKTGIQHIVIKPQNFNTASLHLAQEFTNSKFKIICKKAQIFLKEEIENYDNVQYI